MKKLNILVVDDIDENIHSLKLLIEDTFNCNFYGALSALEGLHVLMENKIDLIFSDIQMPEIDGFEFLNYLRSLDATEKIPVILVSGIALSEQNRKELTNFRDVYFLPKPLNNTKLVSVINKMYA